jgi:hypothetical protein
MTVVHYRGYTIRVEAERRTEGEWIGRGVVVGAGFATTLPSTGPFPTEAAALDAITAAALRWVDQRREGEREGGEPPPGGAPA